MLIGLPALSKPIGGEQLKVQCGNRVFNSFDELGDAILADLPERRQSVKWWVWHKPAVFGFRNCLPKTRVGRLQAWLPHMTTSRSWVGYFWLHLFLFNKWDILFKWGYWESPSWGEYEEKTSASP